MIASDLNNPEFAGAMDPNSRLAVQFYMKPVENEFKSKAAARPVFENVDFVKIWTPGNVLSIIDTPTRQDHKDKFPRQWAAYQNRVGEDTRFVGTPITEWPRITPSQAEELKALKFFTVEAIAGAGDAQLQGIGMIAGQSIFSFRDDAKRFLLVASAASKANEADEKLAAAKAEIAEQQAKHAQAMEAAAKDMAEMKAQMAMLVEAATAQRNKPGPKPKNQEQEAA